MCVCVCVCGLYIVSYHNYMYYVCETILKLFYNSFIENVLTFSFITWFYNLNVKRRHSLQKIANLVPKLSVINLEVCLHFVINKYC